MERLLEIWTDLEGIANALGVPYPTVCSWKSRGIPLGRVKEIIETAGKHGHEIAPWDLNTEFEYLRPESAA